MAPPSTTASDGDRGDGGAPDTPPVLEYGQRVPLIRRAWRWIPRPSILTLVLLLFLGACGNWLNRSFGPWRCVQTIPGATWEIVDRLSADRTRLAVVGGANGRAVVPEVWDLRAGRLIRAMPPRPYDIAAAALSPDGTRLLTRAHFKGRLEIWDVATGNLLATYPDGGPEDGEDRARFTADGKRVIVMTDHAWMLIDATTGSLVATLRRTTSGGTFHGYALSADGSRVFVSEFGAARGFVRRTADGWPTTELHSFSGPSGGELDAAAFAPDGSMLAGTGDWGTRWFDLSSGREIAAVPTGAAGRAYSIAFSPDTRQVAVWSATTLALYDSASGRPTGTLTVSGGDSTDRIIFAPDGKTLLTISTRELRAWDRVTLQRVGRAAARTNRQGGAPLSPDCTRVLAAAADRGAIEVWDWATSSRRAGIRHPVSGGKPLPVADFCFAHDGRHVLTTAADGAALLWQMSRPEPLYGVATLPAFWATITVAGFSLSSMLKDVRRVHRRVAA